MENEYDHLYKILLVGDSGVGKSSLLLRYTEDVFQETFISTIGVDFKMRIITIADKRYKLQIWDTAGQERFRTITGAYYRGAHGILLVYDITQNVTFEHVSMWLNEILRHTPPRSADRPSAVRFLIGNKMDCAADRRAVSIERAKKVSEDNGMRWMEVSAKSNENVESMFTCITSAIYSAHCQAEREAKESVKKSTLSSDGMLLLDKADVNDASCC